MKARSLLVPLLVVGLGAGLHLAFSRLDGELPRVFPRLALEERVAPPPILEEAVEDSLPAGEEDPPPPTGAVPLKRSGEVLTSFDRPEATAGEDPLTGRKLLSPSRLPDISRGGRAVSERFEVTPALVPIVGFWKKVYGVYDSNHVVLHDMDHLEIEYGVLDFSDLDKKGLTDAEKKVAKDAGINAGMAKIQSALSELESWEGLRPLSKEAQRIALLLQHLTGKDKYKKAKEALRSQTGLKNRFAEAVRRSGRYLPIFEKVFAFHGVPNEITRLAFVESMFRERALSKVAAAGLWQFMASSAKKYMTVDPNLDERYDPVVATHGAAKLLLRNYDLLGTWPLAINAYNSGPGNLQKAIQKLGTKDIGTIVTRYKTASYAFASRNFYPSFLAALDVYENHEKYFGPIRKEALWTFDQLELPVTMTFPEVASLSGATLPALKELNPAYSDAVIQGRFSLPPGSQVRLPSGHQAAFASRFVQFAASRVASSVDAPLIGSTSIAKSSEVAQSEEVEAPMVDDEPSFRTSPLLPIPLNPTLPAGLIR